MHRPSIPHLGPVDSLRFGTDVDAFLAAGRRLGPVWSFDLLTGRVRPASRRVTVYSAHGLCRELLAVDDAVLPEADVIADWLGRASPVVCSGPLHAESARVTAQLWAPMRAQTAALVLDAIPRSIGRRSVVGPRDLGEILMTDPAAAARRFRDQRGAR